VCRVLAVVVTSASLLGWLLPSSLGFLALIPGYTIPPHFYVWNIVTGGYLEISLFLLFLDVVGLLLFGRYLEPIWGKKEFLRFILLVNALSGLGTFFLMMFLFVISGSTSLWFKPRCGFSAVLSSFAVALKQLSPEQEIKFLSATSLRAKHLPGIFLLVYSALLVLGFPFETIPLSLFGLVISWTYLRFYQVKESSVGDKSEDFSFASFFPEVLQPSVSIASNVTYNILKLCRCCRDIGTSVDSVVSDLNDSATERRRARALRALDQRMQQMKQSSQTDVRLEIPELQQV